MCWLQTGGQESPPPPVLESGKRFRRLSPPGPSALSSWRLEADAAAWTALLGRPPSGHLQRIAVGPSEAPFDEGLAVVVEGGLELHLHGGEGVAQALLAWLSAAGWREVPCLPWTGRVPELPDAAFARRAFLQAESPRAAAAWAAFTQRDAPATLAAVAAAPPAQRGSWIRALLRHAEWAEALEGVPTLVLAGPANAGKSSLFNAWLGQPRATVADAPGTTRDLLGGSVLVGAGPAAWSLGLLDTAGLWDEAPALDAQAIARSLRALAGADRVLWVCDAARAPGPQASAAIARARSRDLLLLHRCDLPRSWDPRALHPGPWLEGSLRTEGAALIQRLEIALAGRLGPQPDPTSWLPLGFGLRARLRAALEEASGW